MDSSVHSQSWTRVWETRPDDHEENEFDAVIDEDDDDGPDDAEESETEENKGQEELTE